MPHAVGPSKTWYVNCPDCGKKKRRLPMHKSDYCLDCKHKEARLRQRPDIENLRKCLGCGAKIAYQSFRCHPCDGLRAASSPDYKIKRKVYRATSARLRGALNHFRVTKRERNVKYLGCSLEELMRHLEAQFLEGMSWENYGLYGWHIDHIRPVTSYDLNDESQLMECFNYRNMQPMWAKDNIRKGNKIL